MWTGCTYRAATLTENPCSKRHRHKRRFAVTPSAYREKKWKRGGKSQHSKIGPVNKGEDVAGNAVVCGRGDETDTIARCHGKLRVRESGKRAAAFFVKA